MTEHIISNQAKCRWCGDVIYSAHVHDYVTCTCESIIVDGGNEYLRHGWNKSTDFIDMSLTMDEDDFQSILAYTKEMYQDRNELGILYGVFRALRDNGYRLIKEETNGQ